MKAMLLVGALIAAMGAGAARSAPQAFVPAPETAAAEQDPLTEEILHAAVARPNGGLVAAIRLSPELTGVAHEQVITLGAHGR